MVYGRRDEPYDQAQGSRGGDAQSKSDDRQGHPGADTAQHAVLAPLFGDGVTGYGWPPGSGWAPAVDLTGSVV
jgi:hypothetical protein